MKRNLLLMLVATVASLTYCTSSRKSAKANAAAVTYEKNIQPIIAANCAPCHFPSKGGKKPPLEGYTDVTYNIDEILRRIELHPGEKGFMPAKKARLSDSTINLFKEWKSGGLSK